MDKTVTESISDKVQSSNFNADFLPTYGLRVIRAYLVTVGQRRCTFCTVHQSIEGSHDHTYQGAAKGKYRVNN